MTDEVQEKIREEDDEHLPIEYEEEIDKIGTEYLDISMNARDWNKDGWSIIDFSNALRKMARFSIQKTREECEKEWSDFVRITSLIEMIDEARKDERAKTVKEVLDRIEKDFIPKFKDSDNINTVMVLEDLSNYMESLRKELEKE